METPDYLSDSVSSASYLHKRLSGLLAEEKKAQKTGRKRRNLNRRRSSIRVCDSAMAKRKPTGRARRESISTAMSSGVFDADPDSPGSRGTPRPSATPRSSKPRTSFDFSQKDIGRRRGSFSALMAESSASKAGPPTSHRRSIERSPRLSHKDLSPSAVAEGAAEGSAISSRRGSASLPRLALPGGSSSARAASQSRRAKLAARREKFAAAERMHMGQSSVASASERAASHRAAKKAAAATAAKLALDCAARERAVRERRRKRDAARNPARRLGVVERESYAYTPRPEVAALPLERFRTTIFGDRSATLHAYDRHRVARNYDAGLIEEGIPAPRVFIEQKGPATVDLTTLLQPRPAEDERATSLSPRSARRRAAAGGKKPPFACRSIRVSTNVTPWAPSPYTRPKEQVVREMNWREHRIYERNIACPSFPSTAALRIHTQHATPLF